MAIFMVVLGIIVQWTRITVQPQDLRKALVFVSNPLEKGAFLLLYQLVTPFSAMLGNQNYVLIICSSMFRNTDPHSPKIRLQITAEVSCNWQRVSPLVSPEYALSWPGETQDTRTLRAQTCFKIGKLPGWKGVIQDQSPHLHPDQGNGHTER